MPAEVLILASATLALWTWRRLLTERSGSKSWLLAALAGPCGGLAMLAKLNGALALMIVAAWAVLAARLPGIAPGRKLAVAVAAMIFGFGP